MKWFGKIVIILALVTLLALIGGMIYAVRAKYQMNDYKADLEACFSAAKLVNSEEVHTDEASSVLVNWQGSQYILHPDSYAKVRYYLSSNAVPPLLARLNRDQALKLTVCGNTLIWIEFDDDGENALVEMNSSGRHYLMHIHANGLQSQLIWLCTKENEI